MAFTDDSDLYAAIHEEGINRVVAHVMRQRPSLFNYGTAAVSVNPRLFCSPIVAAPGVTQLLTILPPLPLLGAPGFGLDFLVQLTNLEIDFHPGNVIGLPAELDPPLKAQRFAFRARACAGIGCPSGSTRPAIDSFFDLTRVSSFQQKRLRGRHRLQEPARVAAPRQSVAFGAVGTTRAGLHGDLVVRPDGILVEPPVHVFPSRALSCFCLDLLATGEADFTGPSGHQQVRIKLDDVEIVDLQPTGLENSIECYLLLLVNQVLFPQLNDAVSEVLFSLIELGELGSLTLAAATSVPNNPAVEDDQLKAFLDLVAFELTIPPIVIEADEDEGGGGGGGGPDIVKTERARTRTGAFHATAAISEETFLREFRELQQQTTFVILVEEREIVDVGIGRVTVAADIRFHLDGGDVDFRADNTVSIDELDIQWEKLDVDIGIDLKEFCLPEICIPFTDICTPSPCIFSGDPDLLIPLHIPAVFNSEVSVNLRPKVYYGVGPPNKWMAFLEPVGPVDVDLIDVADTVGDLLEDLIDAAVDALGLPDWAADVLGGSVVDTIRFLLDIGDDVGEWLADLVFSTLGVSLSIEELLAEYFLEDAAIFELADPVPVLPADAPLIEVTVPIEFIGVRVVDTEMILEADVGAVA